MGVRELCSLCRGRGEVSSKLSSSMALLFGRHALADAGMPCAAVWPGHEDSVEAVGFSGVQPVALTAGVDGKLVIWDLASLTARSICSHPEVRTRGVH